MYINVHPKCMVHTITIHWRWLYFKNGLEIFSSPSPSIFQPLTPPSPQPSTSYAARASPLPSTSFALTPSLQPSTSYSPTSPREEPNREDFLDDLSNTSTVEFTAGSFRQWLGLPIVIEDDDDDADNEDRQRHQLEIMDRQHRINQQIQAEERRMRQ